MKITLEIPDETVCLHFTLGLQDGAGWGMATFQMEHPEDGGYVRLEMPKENYQLAEGRGADMKINLDEGAYADWVDRCRWS